MDPGGEAITLGHMLKTVGCGVQKRGHSVRHVTDRKGVQCRGALARKLLRGLMHTSNGRVSNHIHLPRDRFIFFDVGRCFARAHLPAAA